MIEQTAKICILGTFDVENYGDDLFALIAKDELQKRIPCAVDFYSPIGGNNLLNDSQYHVHSISDFSFGDKIKIYNYYDTIIVGGGEIIHFNELSLSRCYQTLGIQSIPIHPNRSFFIHFSSAWKNSPPVCFNAVGATSSFSPLQSSIVNKTFSSARYIAVRDEISKKNLSEAGVHNEILVVPDTVFLIKEWSKSRLNKNSIYEIFRSNSIDTTKEPLIGFQCNPAFLQRQQKLIAEALINFAERIGGQIILIPIGYCFEDERALTEIQELDNERIKLIRGKHSTIEITGIISQLDYFIGSSLHGNVTAIAFGIPHVGINTIRHPKLMAFFREIKREKYCIEDWNDIVNLDKLFDQQYKEEINLLANELCEKVNRHFDRLSSEIIKGLPISKNRSEDIQALAITLEKLNDEYEDLLSWYKVSIDHYRESIATTTRLLDRLDSDLSDRTTWALKLDAELNERRAYIQKLQQDFEERTQWALRLDDENKNLREETKKLHSIVYSKVYKLLAELRILPKY